MNSNSSDLPAYRYEDIPLSSQNAILNETSAIDERIKDANRKINQLQTLQHQSLSLTGDSGPILHQIDSLSSEITDLCRVLAQRNRELQSRPEAKQHKNIRQVGRIDRAVRETVNQFRDVEASYRGQMQEQLARQYRIVRPDADDAEVREAVDNAGSSQVFAQTLMQSGRQAQAQATLGAVRDRHAQIVRIEQQMKELALLVQEMDTLVIQAEAPVAQIEQQGQEVVDDLHRGNQDIEIAVRHARFTRKQKWWCLGIVVSIIIIVVVIVLAYLGATNRLGNNKNNS